MRYILASLLILSLAACDKLSSAKTDSAGNPMGVEDTRKNSRGKLTGEDGLLSMGGKAKDGGAPINVNVYLWRASLDTLSFMPLASTDPFGGVIITDWYEDPKTPGERFKVTALILDKTLRADGIKVSVFKQTRSGNAKSGNWKDQTVDSKLARSLEDTILTRARQLKVTQLGK